MFFHFGTRTLGKSRHGILELPPLRLTFHFSTSSSPIPMGLLVQCGIAGAVRWERMLLDQRRSVRHRKEQIEASSCGAGVRREERGGRGSAWNGLPRKASPVKPY